MALLVSYSVLALLFYDTFQSKRLSHRRKMTAVIICFDNGNPSHPAAIDYNHQYCCISIIYHPAPVY